MIQKSEGMTCFLLLVFLMKVTRFNLHYASFVLSETNRPKVIISPLFFFFLSSQCLILWGETKVFLPKNVSGQKVANKGIELSHPFKVPTSLMGNPKLPLNAKNDRCRGITFGFTFLRVKKETEDRALQNTNYSIINDYFQSLGKLHS